MSDLDQEICRRIERQQAEISELKESNSQLAKGMQILSKHVQLLEEREIAPMGVDKLPVTALERSRSRKKYVKPPSNG